MLPPRGREADQEVPGALSPGGDEQEHDERHAPHRLLDPEREGDPADHQQRERDPRENELEGELALVDPPWRAFASAAAAEMNPNNPISTRPIACTAGTPSGISMSSDANRA